MERKDAIAEGESPEKWGEIGDWVQGQLREKLQLLAAPADDQLHHFPPHVAIVAEMIADYLHDSVSIHTCWTLSGEQTRRLAALRDVLQAHTDLQSDDEFWEVKALFSDPRWDEVRTLAKSALVSFEWPIETPPPEPGHI